MNFGSRSQLRRVPSGCVSRNSGDAAHADTGLVAQFPLYAVRQAVFVDINVRLLSQRQFGGERLAAQTHSGHRQSIRGRVVGAKTPKVDGQLVTVRPRLGCSESDPCSGLR